MKETRVRTEYQEVLTGSYDRFFRAGGLYVADRAGSGYANLGLFFPETKDFPEACDNLMDLVVGKLSRRNGSILDVGCGLGGTTRFIVEHCPGSELYGINVSDYQIAQCRERVPGAHFEVMPAEALRFPGATFDAVVSIEAAMHFKGRREFLCEAYRVLKPGGEIVVADMVFHSEPTAFRKVLGGQECYQEIGAYRELWKSCGFADVELDDITKPSWLRFTEFFKNFAFRELLTKAIDAPKFMELTRFADNIAELPVLAYVVAHASKPK